MISRPYVADATVLAVLFLLTAFFAIGFVDFSTAPFEDAAILMRYAEHFAHGYGIVWNIGEKPIDGATDFLFMVLLGLFVKAGTSLEFATRFIGFSSHILTIWILYLSSRTLFRTPLLPALVASICLAFGPGLWYVAAYFGTPFFALFACITWYAALATVQKGETRSRSALFAISALVTALIRPEGVILSSLMLLSIVYIKGLRRSRNTVLSYLGTFAFLGGLYFFWRWQYFGYPLPNPYYSKGGGSIYLDSLKRSIAYTTILCLPFLPAFILGLYSQKTLRMTVGFSIPIIGFAAAFVLISNAMNYAARFQYVLLPIVLMSWWPLIGGVREYLRIPGWDELRSPERVKAMILLIALSLGAIGYECRIGCEIRDKYYRDGRYSIATMLSDYKDRNFSLATTEAGLLPLYSHWKTLDILGLNDRRIAHTGGITEEYLDFYRPNLLMFHAYCSPVVSSGIIVGGSLLKRYAEKNRYVLAAVFGDSPYDTHYYYVRADFPESSEIIRRIRATEYYWFRTGRKAINYAMLCAREE